MYKFIVSIASLAALVSGYTTPTTQCTDGCNPIARPGLNEVIPAGSPYTITWGPTTPGTVTVVLMKGPSENILPLYAIAEKIPNTGSLTWTPATDLVPSGNSGYGLQLINDADGTYQWSTQFGISNSAYVSSSSSAPAVSSSAAAASSSAYPISSVDPHNGTISSAASNGTISSAAASSSAISTGYGNSTAAGTSTAAASSTLRTSATGSRTSSSSTALSSSGATAIGASMVGGFAAVAAAVFAL